MKIYPKNYATIADPVQREIAMLEDHITHLHSLLEIANEHTSERIHEAITQAELDMLHLIGY